MKFLHYLYDLSGLSRHDNCFTTNGVTKKINWSLLPDNIANETDETKFNNFAKETFKCFSKSNESYTHSYQVLHPNLIRYFIKNEVCKIDIISARKKKDKIYLVSTEDEDIRTEISKQIKFGYELSCTLRNLKKMRKKEKNKFNPLLGLFDENDNILMKCEHRICSGDNNELEARIDFTVKLKTIGDQSYFLGFEFLEERAHKRQGKTEYNKIQQERETRILVSNLNVRHVAYVWESLWNRDDGYKQYFIGVIENLFEIYDSADNKEEFGIQYLDNFINNKILSESLYHAYDKKGSHSLEYDIVVNHLGIALDKDILRSEFIQECEYRYPSVNVDEELIISGLSLSDSDNEYEDEIVKKSNDDIIPYIKDDNDKIFINAYGLEIFADVIKRDNFGEKLKSRYIMVKKIYGNIADAAIHAINKVYDMTNDIIFNDIYKSFGLSHRENEPNYPKTNLIKKYLINGNKLKKENVKANGNKKETHKTKEKINEGEKVKIKVNKSKKNKQQNVVV